MELGCGIADHGALIRAKAVRRRRDRYADSSPSVQVISSTVRRPTASDVRTSYVVVAAVVYQNSGFITAWSVSEWWLARTGSRDRRSA